MKQIRNIDMSGAAIGLRLDPDQRYAVHRDIWFDEDIDETWFVGVNRPEAPEIRGDRKGGGIRVSDPAVTGFLRDLFALLADPDHYGDRDLPVPAGIPEAT